MPAPGGVGSKDTHRVWPLAGQSGQPLPLLHSRTWTRIRSKPMRQRFSGVSGPIRPTSLPPVPLGDPRPTIEAAGAVEGLQPLWGVADRAAL